VTSPASFPITFDDDANELLAHDPLALLFVMLLDQQVPMTWAFRSPMVIKERLGDRWSPAAIAAMAMTGSSRGCGRGSAPVPSTTVTTAPT